MTGKTPVVLLGERIGHGPFDHVTIDNVAAARLAVDHLINLGRDRIAAIGHQPYETGETAQLRTRGYRDAIQNAGLRYNSPRRPDGRVSPGCRCTGNGATTCSEEAPDAVFCYNDLLAAGALRTLCVAVCVCLKMSPS